MIKNVFYIDGITYIQDTKDKEITTQNLSFAQSFNFAWQNNVEFGYGNISKEDEQSFSKFLQHQIGDCENRNIYDFFQLCAEYGIKKIIKNPQLFGEKAIKQTINKIIKDYNADVALYNIECYGTDTYIAQVLYEHLMIYNSSLPKRDSKIYALFKLVDNDEYELDVFLDILQIFSDD